jgi:hypothetical protein
MKKITFIIVLIFTTIVAKSQCLPEFPNWLTGTWEIKSEFGSSFEQWTKVNDSTLFGKTFRFFAEDTIVFDTMKIKCQEKMVLFEMTANIKNTRVNAGFPLTQPSPELWKFENPITDSPKNINYMRIGNDSVYVWTETRDVQQACMDFLMIRNKK